MLEDKITEQNELVKSYAAQFEEMKELLGVSPRSRQMIKQKKKPQVR